MVANPRVVYAKLPGTGLPVSGEHLILDKSRSIDLENVPLNGGFLTKTLILSPEPYLRERMRDPKLTSYSTAMVVGTPVTGTAVVVVLRSEREGIKAGDYMCGYTQWEAYTVQPYNESRVRFKPEDWAPHTNDVDSLSLQVVPDPKGKFPLSRYLNVLGTPGVTAWVGLEKFGNVKRGETIFISSGASGVGSMVIQFAKLKGLKIIASAGSDAKVEYMRSLGADAAFNYHKEGYVEPLKKFGTIDIVWDNVGGPALEAALDAASVFARIIYCGSSADYSVAREDRHGIKNTTEILKKRLTINGIIVLDHLAEYGPKFFAEAFPLLEQGVITSKEHVIEGMDNAVKALIDTFGGGDGVGKPVVVVAEA